MTTLEARGGNLVLLVEDEAIIAMTLQDDLEERGYRVIGPFSDCSSALHALRTTHPSLAVLDINLTDGPCDELARKLIALKVPFIVYSGIPPKGCAAEFQSAPWIGKPAPFKTIISALIGLVPDAPALHHQSPTSSRLH